MKTSRKKIIEANRSLFARIVGDIRPGDDIDLVDKRIGDRLSVVPDDPPNPGEQINVVFRLESVMAVSKGANLAEIINLLSMAPDGSFAALGTGLTGGAITAGQGIAQASVETLGRVMNTPTSANNIKLLVPLTNITPSTPPIMLKADASVEGWTRTNDWDGDEVANFYYHTELLSLGGNIVKTLNEGESRPIEIDASVARQVQPIAGAETLAAVDLSWQLSTDGAWTHDTISLIQISTVSLTLTYGA